MENTHWKNEVRKLLWLESLVAKRSHEFPTEKNAGMSGWRFQSRWTLQVKMGKLLQRWRLIFWMPIFKTLGKHKLKIWNHHLVWHKPPIHCVMKHCSKGAMDSLTPSGLGSRVITQLGKVGKLQPLANMVTYQGIYQWSKIDILICQ